ncbi:MAG: NAD(P)/FAD-dependent oxidoreductase [Promethearchaeota archaeon]|nr:MAG: NAD(P)/FAD-dependent oxidoreductase [Candidatus Lokiarchaeota archaeon]
MKAIIIGSGISGLTAGCYLVKNGWDVTIYEQFNKIGGVTAQIEKEGYKWDLGQMLIEGAGQGEPIGLIFSELGVFDKIKTIRTERAYVFPDFALYKPEKYTDVLWRREKFKELFPSDIGGIDKYYKFYYKMMEIATFARRAEQAKGLKSLALKIKMFLKLLPLLPKKNWDAQKMMEYFFNSEKLQSVFLTILADFVTPPTQFIGLGVPFINPEPSFDEDMPLQLSETCQQPSYRYILGGMGSIVKAMVDMIKEGNGKFYVNKPIKKIIIDEDVAKGVLCEDGTEDKADLIIASGGAREIFLDVVGKEHLPEDFVLKILDIPLMESVFMIHLGIEIDPTPYQKLTTAYYYGNYEVDEAIKECRSGSYHEGRDGFVIFIPTIFSPELAPQSGHHAMTIYTIAPNILNQGTWEQRKEELADKLLLEAERVIPGLREKAKVKVILTPDDFKKITHLKHHSFGGFAPIMGKSGGPHQTPIKNFWFIGAQSEGGAGLANLLPDTSRTMKKILKAYSK